MGWFELIQGYYRYHVYFGERVDEEYCPPQKKIKTDGASNKISYHDNTTRDKQIISNWQEYDTLLIFQYQPIVSSKKIALFDLDNTLIQTSSGKKFPSTHEDWKFMTQVVDKLISVSKDGYRIIILSNQLGIGNGKLKKDDFMQKIESIATKLKLPFLMLASTARDRYRKPCIGMWEYLLSQKNEIDMKLSFYVGDAAGRMNNWMPGILDISSGIIIW